jgi:hypothetical protein
MPGYTAAVPVRRITEGPAHHWFAYYDKLQFDPSQRFVLGMAVDFEHRSPRPDDVIQVGMVDLQDGDRWIELGETRAWCWQQGCMLQWRPGGATEVLWNDREADRFVCHILDVATGERRTIPHAVYTVSPDGRWAVAPDFRRVNHMRPGYGYTGLPDPHEQALAPEESGIWLIDLDSGEAELVVTIADVARIPYSRDDLSAHRHYFNHLLWNTDGTRFEFLHRWCGEGIASFDTRMITAAADGSDVRVVDDSGKTSHFIWRDPAHILAWSWHESCGDAFYLFEDGDQPNRAKVVGEEKMPLNGHVSYLADTEWVLNDTYPIGEPRAQTVYLYHVPTDRRIDLGRFESPDEYAGEWRCDLHPRSSPDGTLVTIDAACEGGRQLYLLDIGEIVNGDHNAG